MTLERVWKPYWQWEDFHAGLYDYPFALTMEVGHSRALLADPAALGDAMRAVVDRCPNATAHNLSNYEQNRRAWLGQAACCIELHSKAVATRAAWWQLAEAEQRAANHVAELVIAEWEMDNAQTLFGY